MYSDMGPCLNKLFYIYYNLIFIFLEKAGQKPEKLTFGRK